jgi:ubiquinone biosynthesis protein
MKLPRSFKIFRLVRRAGSSFLHNEPYTLSDSLQDLDDLGGVYIKFLQMVVLQMEPHAQRDFGQVLAVFEHSKPDDVDIIRYLKRAQPRLMRHIVMLEPKPFATGSFGQVYRAQLDNGDDVVIKVLRPSVVKYLKSDLRLLSFMTFWVGVFDRQKLFNFRNIYKQFRTTSLRETNYLREAAVSSAYYKSFKDHPYLVVPRTYQGLSSKTVLVQQNIHGLSVASVLERQAAHGDARVICFNSYMLWDMNC